MAGCQPRHGGQGCGAVPACEWHHPEATRAARHICVRHGLKPDEAKARSLLASRLAPAYATEWNEKVFATIDRQMEVAAKLGIIDKAAPGKLYRHV